MSDADRIAELEAENERLKAALKAAHLPAETSKVYPTIQSEAVQTFCLAAFEVKP
jgi:hypothetical protein